MPKVSIIVAVHNGETSIRNFLHSIKVQTLKDFEVLLINAGSTDSTGEIFSEFASADGRFKIFERTNDSISEARNLGIEKSQGKYLAFGDANVIFKKNVLEGMYLCAERENADLCVAPMTSMDIYGRHDFSTTNILSRRKQTNKFDMTLIWNPSVTNKLFLKSKVIETNSIFRKYGKAREAAFSLPFAFKSNLIVCSSKGAVCYVNPFISEEVTSFKIEHYLDAYKYIISEVAVAFQKAMAESKTDFDKLEYNKQMVCYIDQVYHKEITVLLYSYYRHFWFLSDEEVEKYTKIITDLYSKLSKSGKKAVRKKNSDIFYGENLISNRKYMAENPKATVCLGRSLDMTSLSKEVLEKQVTSIFAQTMPSFELFVDEKLFSIFPEKWKNCENVTFIEASSLGEFRDISLEKCKTDFIMFQEGFARLNPKILMRHYSTLQSKEKYDFTTSPITRFDGKSPEEYIFSSYYFSHHKEKTRIDQMKDKSFRLDLFFCNKLFRASHLRGIHFSFSDNSAMDMLTIYLHSRFKKIDHRGAYLPFAEDEAIQYLKANQGPSVSDSKKIYSSYKRLYYKRLTKKKVQGKVKEFFKKIQGYFINYIGYLLTLFYSRVKIRNRVFFYTSRAENIPLENLNCVYEEYKGEKILFAKEEPHTLLEKAKIRKYLLTSKIIVTDDYINILRKLRLRPEQKVIQLWYSGGALRRFGLEDPLRGSQISEFKAHSQYTDVIVSSEYVRPIFSHAFGVDMKIIKALGNPRTDYIVNEKLLQKSKEEMCKKHPLLKDKKRIYVYFPTSRMNDDGEIVSFDPKLKWSEINDELYDDEIFIICRHPSVKEEYIKGMLYPRAKDYTSDTAMELLSVADVVITDYSAILFDASIMKKPVVFYCPDLETYNGEFYIDFEKDAPGEIIKDPKDLIEAMRRAKDASSDEKIESFKEKMMGACDGHSTERVCRLIEEYSKEN